MLAVYREIAGAAGAASEHRDAKSVLGPAFKVSGKGKVISFPEGEGGGTLNLNLSVGARAVLVELLTELGVLAPVQTKGEYRMLHKNPLAVHGPMESPDIPIFSALLA